MYNLANKAQLILLVTFHNCFVFYLTPSLSQAFCHEAEQKCFLLRDQKVYDSYLVKNSVDLLEWRFFFSFTIQHVKTMVK